MTQPSFLQAIRAMLGSSPRISATRELIERAGRSNAPILLLGETGTGKELAARAVHAVSCRGAFVTVDCAALPSTLMESELFGYTRGAFTGAIGRKRGLIEAADGGTVFFDEIGELAADQQAKLLRLLQEKEFRPLGATEPRRADFRVISATNRDLSTEIRCGRFRSDLYYRLKVITLRLPPLRERKEDIPLLVEHFLSRYGDGRPVSPEVMQILGSYDWPGNIRELENSIYAMTALGRGESLGVVDLPEELRGVAAQWQTTQRRKSPYYQDYGNANGPSFPLVPLAEVERLVIIRALRFTHGDCTRTAAILHIGRTTLYRKLREYHVPMEKAPRAVQRDWQAGLDPALPSEVGFFRSLPAGELIVQFSPMAPVPSSAPDPLTLLILEPIEVRFPSRLVLPATATATTGTAAATVAL